MASPPAYDYGRLIKEKRGKDKLLIQRAGLVFGLASEPICHPSRSGQYPFSQGVRNGMLSGAVARNNHIRLRGSQCGQSLIDTLTARGEQVEAANDGSYPRPLIQASNVVQCIHQSRMAAPDTDDQTIFRLNPQC